MSVLLQNICPIICRIISCLKGLTLFYHVSHKDGMHISLGINNKQNTRKMKHAYNGDKTRSIILKR